MKSLLLGLLEVGHKAVMFTVPCAVAMIFIACSGASVVGAYAHTAVTR